MELSMLSGGGDFNAEAQRTQRRRGEKNFNGELLISW
jgi:hypothetical protein